MIMIQHLVEHAVVIKLAFASDLDQARLCEDFQVPRDRRLRQREVPHKLPATGLSSPGNRLEDVEPRRIRQRLGRFDELLWRHDCPNPHIAI
jgi:hypothetical protein